MSFGFSVGDFVAVGELISKIVVCLSDAGGSKDDYQTVIHELKLLQKILHDLQALKCDDQATYQIVDYIRCHALSCRLPLERFLALIDQYAGSLSSTSRAGYWKSAPHKIRWALSHEVDVAKLHSYLGLQVGILNTLLERYNILRQDKNARSSAQKLEEFRNEVVQAVDVLKYLATDVRDQVSLQSQVMHTQSKNVSRLTSVILDSSNGWTAMCKIINHVSDTTQRIYVTVFESRAILASLESLLSTTQGHHRIEDALGRVFTVDPQFDFRMIDIIIRGHFAGCPGFNAVQAGQYELSLKSNSRQVVTAKTFLRPGMHIVMAITLPGRSGDLKDGCPSPLCRSTVSVPAKRGGRICSDCSMWYDNTSRSTAVVATFEKTIASAVMALSPAPDDRTVSSEALELDDDEISSLRNIRLLPPVVILPNRAAHDSVRIDNIHEWEILNPLKIPSGTIISPPDSDDDDDENSTRAMRRAEVEKTWQELQNAVKAIKASASPKV